MEASAGRAAPASSKPLSRQDAGRPLAQGLPLGPAARRMLTSGRTVRRRTRAAGGRLSPGAPIQAVVRAAHESLL